MIAALTFLEIIPTSVSPAVHIYLLPFLNEAEFFLDLGMENSGLYPEHFEYSEIRNLIKIYFNRDSICLGSENMSWTTFVRYGFNANCLQRLCRNQSTTQIVFQSILKPSAVLCLCGFMHRLCKGLPRIL